MPGFFLKRWHAITGIMIMKNICAFFLFASFYMMAFSQQPPVNDTLIPKQQLDDTAQNEPKLQGGAIIDTINIKKSDNHPGYLLDTLEEKNSRDKPKENRY